MAGGATMKQRLLGPLGPLMARHLQLRRSLGFILGSDEIALDQFDRFVAAHFPAATSVTKPMVVGYLKTLDHLHPATQQHQIGTLRQFCRFLFQLNPDTYIPEKGIIPVRKIPKRFYIYTPVEIAGLIQSAKTLPPIGSLRPHTYATIIGLLWVSGLRIGEVLRLNLQDVELERNILIVRQTKFFKSRMVPVTQSTSNALSDYRTLRAHYGHCQNPDAPFFVNQRAKRCVNRTVSWTFRTIARSLNFKSAKGNEPRIYDLRHTFATRSLAALYKDGKDPNAGLPVLATYLGHVNIACTTVYLHPSIELLHEAASKFHRNVEWFQGGSHERI